MVLGMKPRLFSALVLICIGALARPAGAMSSDAAFSRPGVLVPTSDGSRLNLICSGHGSPAVVFDAGDGDWSAAWALVQPRVAEWTTACSYDRAGLGFSAPGPRPRTLDRLAGELRDALRRRGVRGPYVLVGHAFGGYTVRAFADLFPDDVAGLVLIEPDSRDLEDSADLAEIWKGIYARNMAQLAFCRDAVAAGRKLPVDPPADHPSWTCTSYNFRGLPEAKFSTGLNAALLRLIASKPALWDAIIAEHETWWQDDAWLRDHRTSFGSKPLRLMTADHHITDRPGATNAQRAEHEIFNRERKRFQGGLLHLSTDAARIYVDTGAFIELDQPDLVVDTIRDVWTRSR
jgi:pimeloyl-ACP methyl ester carboxylesterase